MPVLFSNFLSALRARSKVMLHHRVVLLLLLRLLDLYWIGAKVAAVELPTCHICIDR